MLDNDYRLPTYLSASDHLSLPMLNGGTVPQDISALLDRAAGKGGVDLEVPPAQASLNANGKTNGEVDRQKGNVNGHEGWIETPKAAGPPADGQYPVLAIDCEMVSLNGHPLDNRSDQSR